MGTALRSRSELPEVVLRFEFHAFLAERLRLRTLHGEVRTRKRRAEGAHEHRVGLEPIERRAQRGRIPLDPTLLPLAVGQGAWINEHGLARLELARDAVEPGREQSTQCE